MSVHLLHGSDGQGCIFNIQYDHLHYGGQDCDIDVFQITFWFVILIRNEKLKITIHRWKLNVSDIKHRQNIKGTKVPYNCILLKID